MCGCMEMSSPRSGNVAAKRTRPHDGSPHTANTFWRSWLVEDGRDGTRRTGGGAWFGKWVCVDLGVGAAGVIGLSHTRPARPPNDPRRTSLANAGSPGFFVEGRRGVGE